MENLICVSMIGKKYLYVDADTLKKSSSTVQYDDNFNAKKFLRAVDRNENVLTVVGKIEKRGVDIGFLTCDKDGNFDTIDIEYLMNSIKSGWIICMNYTTVTKEGKTSLRKAPNLKLKTVSIRDTDRLMGIKEKELVPQMDRCGIEDVMNYHGFKVGLEEICTISYDKEEDKRRVGRRILYYNKDGAIVNINHVNGYLNDCSLWTYRKITDKEKADQFISKYNKKLGCKGVVREPDIMEFTIKPKLDFFRLLRKMDEFSIPCVPYPIADELKDENLLGIMLNWEIGSSLVDVLWNDNYIERGVEFNTLSSVGIGYLGLKRVKRLPKNIQKFYLNYENNYISNARKVCNSRGISDEKFDYTLQVMSYIQI